MKKLLSLIFIIGLCIFGLCGCQNSNVTYKDPTTGEEKELKIEKTTDEVEVADSLYAVALSETPVKEVSTTSAKLTFKANVSGKDKTGKDQKIDVKGSIELNESFDKDAKLETTLDVLKAFAFNAKVELSGTIPNENGEEQKFAKSTIELFLEEGVAYAKINLDAKLANFIASEDASTGGIIQLVNEKILKLDLSTLVASEALTAEQKADIESVLEGKNSKSFKQLLEENGAELGELKAQIEALVKEYGITISKVKGGKVTYSADFSKKAFVNSESKLTADVTINVADVSFAGASVKAEIKEEDAQGTVDASLEVKYKGKVAKISNADKEKAIDAMALMRGLK